jgi:hypothetical protein
MDNGANQRLINTSTSDSMRNFYRVGGSGIWGPYPDARSFCCLVNRRCDSGVRSDQLQRHDLVSTALGDGAYNLRALNECWRHRLGHPGEACLQGRSVNLRRHCYPVGHAQHSHGDVACATGGAVAEEMEVHVFEQDSGL